MDAVIQYEGIRHNFGSGDVLAGIDASVRPGQVTVLCGPNAAGKTTLLRIGAGLLSPSGGRVLLKGEDFSTLSVAMRARLLGFMPQRFECTSGFSVRRVLELARVVTGRNQAAVDRVIEEFELADLVDRSVGTLSIGQCQRVALARVLAQVPEDGMILLDEPLSALDPRWENLASEVLRQRAHAGATVLLSVHALATAGRLADDVLLLAQGRLAASGSALEVLDPAILGAAFAVEFELVKSQVGFPVPLPLSPRRQDTDRV